MLAASRRYASDDHTPSVLCKPSWQERIFGTQASRSASKVAAKRPNPKPEDMPEPEPDSDSIFSPSRTQAAKAALEPRLRCTEVDENGEVIMVDGEFKKSELIAKVWRMYTFHSFSMVKSMCDAHILRFSMACYHEIFERLTLPIYRIS